MANNAIDNCLEFDESELFHEDDAVGQLDEDMTEEEPASKLHGELDTESDSEPDFDKSSDHEDGDELSESSKSASLQLHLHGMDAQGQSPTALPIRPVLGTTYTPRPVIQAKRMAKSLPVNISHVSKWREASTAEPPIANEEVAKQGPKPMVQLHKLYHKEDFESIIDGVSPAASLKRERLRNRNAILIATGFLEKDSRAIAAMLPQEAKPTAASSLTAQLATISEC